ncbi:hypothetical protein C5S35_02690 [Candidatus Methanophagaceae archaeon]|jgi:hypothetical protein|nr:hypothetical protein C5S35_02690 [Methanophagales archaeon]
MLADRKMNLENVARNLEIISFTVKEYLNIYKEFKGGDDNAKQFLFAYKVCYENMAEICLYPIWEF